MRILAAMFSLLILAGALPAGAWAGEVQTIEAIDNAAGMLDEAFEAQDAEAIKALTTPDHIGRDAATMMSQQRRRPADRARYPTSNISRPISANLACTLLTAPKPPCGASLQS